ncbi:MAG: response regulator [Syntrophales bacterium]|nr:response regulator [Syntrophales bacterium]
MTAKDEIFLKRLLTTFKVEADEHLKVISDGIIALEKTSSGDEQRVLFETIFRESHTLKGASRSVNMSAMEAVCRSLENVFAALQKNEIPLSGTLFPVLYQAIDGLTSLLSSAGVKTTGTGTLSLIEPLIHQLDQAAKGQLSPVQDDAGKESQKPDAVICPAATVAVLTVPPSPVATALENCEKAPLSFDTVRVPTAKLDALLFQAEGLIAAKMASRQRAVDLRGVCSRMAVWKKEWDSVQQEMPKAASALPSHRIRGFLAWNEAFLKGLDEELEKLRKALDGDSREIGGMVDNLLKDTKNVLMLPFSLILEGYPLLVRRLAAEQGKEIDLSIQGGEIEVDKRILQEMKDPLMHLVRNSIDHGIESPEERKYHGKTPCGKLTIAAAPRDSGKVEITITDDGKGIDAEEVKRSLLKLGIIPSAEMENMTDEEVLSYIFHSGLSTSPIVTNLSGRGLGLAIAGEKVEKLGGRIFFETRPGAGTTFRLLLPLSLATFRGCIINVCRRIFVIPTMNVERVLMAKKEELKTVENREAIRLDGRLVSVVRLADVLGLVQDKEPAEESRPLFLLILEAAGERLAFSVDEIVDEQEVLIKGLGKQLRRVPNIAGACILGTGRVAPILNVQDLMKSAILGAAAGNVSAAMVTDSEARGRSILVVEDSITARTLLRNILETAGYEVKTAVDGVDAFTYLQVEMVDLIVSDVQMPRMDGFELTQKIRANKRLADLPVILVTSMESPEDRKRGIDAGADAYMVKSSFDQDNLLEMIRRLI